MNRAIGLGTGGDWSTVGPATERESTRLTKRASNRRLGGEAKEASGQTTFNKLTTCKTHPTLRLSYDYRRFRFRFNYTLASIRVLRRAGPTVCRKFRN